MGSALFIFALCWPFLAFFSRKPGRYAAMNRIRRFMSRWSATLSGIFFRIRYEQAIDWTAPAVICANHSSNLDVSAVSLAIRGDICFMGKEDLLKHPIMRYFFRSVDIPVNRESKLSAFRAFKKAEESLQKGISIIIFPEGKIADAYPPQLQDFKMGAFRLAVQLGVPVIPVSITHAWPLMWDDGKTYGSRPGICDIFVHSPVQTRGLALQDAGALSDAVRQIIDEKIQAYAT